MQEAAFVFAIGAFPSSSIFTFSITAAERTIYQCLRLVRDAICVRVVAPRVLTDSGIPHGGFGSISDIAQSIDISGIVVRYASARMGINDIESLC